MKQKATSARLDPGIAGLGRPEQVQEGGDPAGANATPVRRGNRQRRRVVVEGPQLRRGVVLFGDAAPGPRR